MTRSLAQPPTRDSPAPETCIIVSSHGNPTVFEKFANASVNVGVMFSDECHLAMKLESRSMAIAVAQSKVGRGGMDLWLVSATPIRFLIDWELPISLIANSIDLSRAASVMDVVTAHAAAKSSDDNMRRFLALWSKVFDKDLVLRNVVTSQFCGKSITDLRTILPNTVWLKTPDQHHEDVQAVAHQAREVIRTKALAAQEDEALFQPDYASGIDPRLYFVSLFPGAAALIRKGLLSVDEKNITDSISAIKDSNKLKVEKSAHFPQHLDEIARNSPKLDFVLEEIKRMQRDKDVRAADTELPANSHGENLALKKMVIITPTLGTAVFLYLILLKRVPELAPALLHSRARASDREAALNSFTSLTARKTAKHSYILITSFSGGGTGLNLQSANYQILMSPLSSRDHEIQAFARTNRTGQRLALHHSRLISVDSAADRINVVSFAGRSIKNDPFEMGRRLVLSESDGFKRVQRLEDWGYQVDDTEIDSLPYMVENLYSAGCEYQACKITFPAESKQSIDELVYFGSNTMARDVLCINEAWNARRDSRARHEKLPLRDILLGLWVFNLNRSAHDLKHLVYFTVIEASLNHTLRPHVYRLLGEDMRNQLVIHRESESSQEAEAFSLLIEEAPFCAGAEKMLREYSEFSDVHIASFDFLPVILEGMDDDEPFFDFRINFQ
ncbi:hypothetical protein N8I77_005470 [Diaporthe amygdali]|uniref:Helicase C-terminal domain-containing protein n=1 Tax=Phomopsis amygdali TaxID=1214568 RepID=A0AAD9SFR6_PHOAM|nr:hypothetical protein N8I77_005470 [Diaporthe amygdali]